MSLQGKTLFITGASRGIGLAIALKAAADGANIAIAAKTVEPHPKLEGTIHTAAAEIEKAGGHALPLVVDVRDESSVKTAIDQTAARFGGIDIVVNNASAIQLTPVTQTDMRRFDLLHQINTRGTFLVSKYAIPHLQKAANPHIHDVVAAARHGGEMVRAAYRVHHGEIRHEPGGAGACRRIARQSRRQCAVAAHDHRHRRGQEPARRRSDDAAFAHAGDHCRGRLSPVPQAQGFTGNFLIDDTFLAGEGVNDFDRYRVDPTQPLQVDFFVPDSMPPPQGVSLEALK